MQRGGHAKHLESAALPAAHGVLNCLPEVSDFSQRVRHLNSVSREAETLTPDLRQPATSLRQATAALCEPLLEDQNFFVFAQNTSECPYVCSLGRSWSDFWMQLRAS